MATSTGISRIEKVRQGLLRDLADGRVQIGGRIANEQRLTERFAVSRSSVREAVSSLVTLGYLERRHGSGTYVVGVPGAFHALDATLSYTRMISDAGMTPGVVLLDVVSRPATTDEASDLRLSPGEPVRVLERLRTADGRPVVYSRDVLPESLVGDLADQDFRGSLYDVLDRVGLTVVSALADLTPVLADRRLARVLSVKGGSPLQRIHEVDHLRNASPIVTSEEWHVPGVFELQVHRRT